MSSYVLNRAFDVHDCMDQPIPAPRCPLGSTAFEMELLDPVSELGPAPIEPPGRDATSRHQRARGDARGQLNEPVHALYTIRVSTNSYETLRDQRFDSEDRGYFGVTKKIPGASE